MVCHHCGETIKSVQKIGRQETCSGCGNYLHCCFNCRFYVANAYHQCRETEAEWVRDKASANFCDYFQPGDKGAKADKDRAAEARKKLEALFGNKDEEKS